MREANPFVFEGDFSQELVSGLVERINVHRVLQGLASLL